MRFHSYLKLLIPFLCPLAQAAEPDEGADNDLGRLFMSPEQRVELDRLRKIPPELISSGAPNAQVVEEKPDPGENASGFIIRAEGEAYLWVDDDFKKVRNDPARNTLKDQRITITRHGQSPSAVKNPSSTEPADEEQH
ncbi:MAG: hypothetical protein ACR2QR_09520 [Woeseiaceae bacterium]